MRFLIATCFSLMVGCSAAYTPGHVKLAGPVPQSYVQHPLEFPDDCGSDAATDEPWCTEEHSDDEYVTMKP